MESWFREVKNCKKINKNIVSKKFTGSTTTELMERLKNKKYRNNLEEVFDNEINEKFDYKCDYILEKNKSLGIDRSTDRRLKGGKIKIDLRVDFHGLTINEAFELLKSSIENGYNDGLKLILFITGKGHGTKENRDSIKSLIGNWMKDPFISSKVIKYTDAQQRDGGTGAIYVLLKNKYKKLKK